LVIEVSSESVVNGQRHDRLKCGVTGNRLRWLGIRPTAATSVEPKLYGWIDDTQLGSPGQPCGLGRGHLPESPTT